MKILLRIVYNTLYLVLLPLAFVIFLIVNPRRCLRELKKTVTQRLGFYPTIISDKPLIVFRCASLGEVRVVSRIIDAFENYFSVLAVGTLSAYEHASKNAIGDSIVFTPPDFFIFTKNFFRRIKTNNLILIESEIWPEFVSSAKDSGIKIFLVNGRFSPSSVAVGKRLRWLLKPFVKKLDYFFVRYNFDKESLKILDISDDKIKVTGNIKYVFDQKPSVVNRRDLGFRDDEFIVVAGSTHRADEKVLLSVFGILQEKFDNIKLLVVPRHTERSGSVREMFLNADFLEVSPEKAYLNANKKCLIIDRVGILEKLYSICDVAVVGGSFGSRGGQDPIEPAYFSKPVIFGPNMQNFSTETAELLYEGGAVKVSSSAELLETIESLLKNPEKKKSIGANARKVIDKNIDAKQNTVDELLKMLSPAKSGTCDSAK